LTRRRISSGEPINSLSNCSTPECSKVLWPIARVTEALAPALADLVDAAVDFDARWIFSGSRCGLGQFLESRSACQCLLAAATPAASRRQARRLVYGRSGPAAATVADEVSEWLRTIGVFKTHKRPS